MPTYLRGIIKKSAVQFCSKTDEAPEFLIVKRRKYSSLKLNKHFFTCVCDVPITVLAKVIGVSETFLKKYKKLLSIQRWPQFNLYFEECQFIQLQRSAYVEQLRQNSEQFVLWKFSESDRENLIEVLEEIQNFAAQYNEEGIISRSEQKWYSSIIKKLFNVTFECKGQKVVKNNVFLEWYLQKNENDEEMDTFVRDVLWTSLDDE